MSGNFPVTSTLIRKALEGSKINDRLLVENMLILSNDFAIDSDRFFCGFKYPLDKIILNATLSIQPFSRLVNAWALNRYLDIQI